MKVRNIRQKVRSSAGAAAVAYDDDSGEAHRCSKYFMPGQMIHSYDYADDDGDDRLDVAVHTDKRRPDSFLSDRNQEVSDESGQDYQIGKFGILD